VPISGANAQKELDTTGYEVPLWVRYELHLARRQRFTGQITLNLKDGMPQSVETRCVKRIEDIVSS
jgi:hypothetical protein